MTRTTSYWIKETPNGERKFRAITKVLSSILIFLFSGLLYLLLYIIGKTQGGAEIIMVLAIGVITLVVMACLMVLMVSLIDHLRSFE